MRVTSDQIEERMRSGEIDSEPYIIWSQINKSLIEFQNKANKRTFTKLFTPYAEADRLWNHFTQDCDCKFQQFLTYLTQEQKNELIYNAHENQLFLYS